MRTVFGFIFLPFRKIIVSFFSFLCQDANKTKSNCAIIGCDLSKKHKLRLHKTQNGEQNYVDHKFFFNFFWELPTCTKPWGRHPNTIELDSWLGHVLCDFKATWHQEAYFSVSWICSWVHLGDAYILPFWWKSSLWVFIFCYKF